MNALLMPAKALAAAVAICTLANQVGAQGLIVQSPFPTGRNLGGVAFISPTHGFLVGDNHHLIETLDAGQTWITRMGTGFSTDPFYTIAFASPTHGYIAGNNQDAYRTTNGGTTWVQMAGMQPGSVRALDFVTPTAGFAGYNGACTWTPDGGISWQVRSGYPSAPIVFGMDFRDAQVGLASGIRSTPYNDGGIYRSANGGSTWSLVHSGSVNDVLWISDTSALAIDGLWIFRSDDEGMTWSLWSGSPIDTGLSEFTRIGATDTLAGVSTRGDIWISPDLGQSWWRVIDGIGVLPARWSISFHDDLNGWVVGANGLTYRTNNGGQFWTLVNSGCGDDVTDIRFFDDLNGMAVTYNGFVFITRDSGARWEVQRLRVTGQVFGRTEGLQAVCPISQNDWWVGGNGGVLFHTLDQGEFWISMGYPNQPWGDADITDIHFLDAQNGWVATNDVGSATLWRTSDGGFSWTPAPGVIGWVASVDFEGTRGWAAYAADVVMRTVDGGNTWSAVTVPGSASQAFYSATALDFCDPSNGWVVGYYGSVARSTNGGATWTPQMQPQNETFLDVKALSPSEAWLVGYDTNLHRYFYKRTTNGGTTWTRTDLPYEESFSEIEVRPSGRAWFAGSAGKIVVKPAPALSVSLPSGAPAVAAPGQSVSFPIAIVPGEQQVASAELRVRRTPTGAWESYALQFQSATIWTGTLPAFTCADSPQFYISVLGSGGTVVNLPSTAPSSLFSLRVGTFSTQALIDEGFATGLPSGWTGTGLWHVSASCPPPGTCGSGAPRAYYGLDSTCTFNTGARTAGVLRSPSVALPTLQAGQSIMLTFCTALDTEYPDGAYGDDDQAQLWWVSGTTQVPLEWFTDHSTVRTRTFSLNAFAGQTGRLEWRFDSMNTYMNSFRGWHIDDVRLSAPVLVCIPTCDPDVNCDGSADGFDIEAMERAVAGDTTDFCHGDVDFNRDGSVDGFDIESVERVVGGAPCP